MITHAAQALFEGCVYAVMIINTLGACWLVARAVREAFNIGE